MFKITLSHSNSYSAVGCAVDSPRLVENKFSIGAAARATRRGLSQHRGARKSVAPARATRRGFAKSSQGHAAGNPPLGLRIRPKCAKGCPRAARTLDGKELRFRNSPNGAAPPSPRRHAATAPATGTTASAKWKQSRTEWQQSFAQEPRGTSPPAHRQSPTQSCQTTRFGKWSRFLAPLLPAAGVRQICYLRKRVGGHKGALPGCCHSARTSWREGGKAGCRLEKRWDDLRGALPTPTRRRLSGVWRSFQRTDTGLRK